MIAIAATSLNNVIGYKNKIPWYLPEDFKHFKETTQGNVILMGRKTFESLPKLLPNREHWVLTRNKVCNGVVNINDINNLPKVPENKKLFVIGGEQIYKIFLPQCSELILTIVNGNYIGDTFFPEYKHLFNQKEIIKQVDEFTILRYYKSNEH